MTPSHKTLAQLGTLPNHQQAQYNMQFLWLCDPASPEPKEDQQLVDGHFTTAYLFLYSDVTIPAHDLRDPIRKDIGVLIYGRLSSEEDYLMVLQQAEKNGKRIQANRGAINLEAAKSDEITKIGSLLSDHWVTLDEPAKWSCHPFFYRVHPEDIQGSTEGLAVED